MKTIFLFILILTGISLPIGGIGTIKFIFVSMTKRMREIGLRMSVEGPGWYLAKKSGQS